MNISIIIKKLKHILSEKKLNQLGKTTGFTKRKRNVSAFQLVTAMIYSFGDRNTDYLSDILRVFNHLTKQNVKYKPFNNQLSKPALAELMKEVTERVFSHWINDVLKYNKVAFSKFKQVSIQDGSTVAVKSSLKNIWPCRFKQSCPAAIELHATLNLTKGSIDKATITPDTFSERAEIPEYNDLKGHLFLADRGYYSADFVIELDKAGGFYVLRAKGLKKC